MPYRKKNLQIKNMKAQFFATADDLQKWFEVNHKAETELLVGYYKKHTKKPSITWSESVDEALCVGWIDGIRRKIDAESYSIRFTPRKAKSHWSAVNIKKVAQLKKEGRMKAEGLAAFARLDPKNSELAAYETKKNYTLPDSYLEKLQANTKAWQYFDALAPGYKKQTVNWIMAAKREVTRDKRFQILIDSSEQGLKVPLLRRKQI